MTIWQKLTGAAMLPAGTGALAAGLRAVLGAPPAGHPAPATDIRFTIALIALCAKMARSDGVVTVDEIEAFRRVVEVPAGEEANVRRLFDLARQDVAGFETYARQIAALFEGEPQLKRDVIEALFVIAAADGILHEKEDAYLAEVARLLAVPPAELAFLRSHFVAGTASPYEILGLMPSATDAEIKARHRALVLANHPDKLVSRGLPAEFVALSERKLAAINAAFDVIARERGL